MVTKSEDDQYTADLGLDPAGEARPPKSEKEKKAERDAQAQAVVQKFLAAHGGKVPANFLQGLTAEDLKGAAQMSHDTKPFPKEEPIGDIGEQFDKSGAPTEIGGQQLPAGAADAKANVIPPPKPTTTKSTAPTPAEDMINNLVGQYQAAMGVVDPYINGSVGATDVANATAAGASMGGATQPAPAAAAGIDSTLSADAQAYQKANDAGAGGVQTAMKNTGLADQAYLNASPYMSLLNSAITEAGYKQELAAQGGAGLALPANAPIALTNAIKNLSSSATSSSGAVPVGAQPASSSTTPSTSTQSTAGGGNG